MFGQCGQRTLSGSPFALLPFMRPQMDKLLAGLTQRVASGVDQHTVGLVTRLDFNGFYSKSS